MITFETFDETDLNYAVPCVFDDWYPQYKGQKVEEYLERYSEEKLPEDYLPNVWEPFRIYTPKQITETIYDFAEQMHDCAMEKARNDSTKISSN